MGSHAFFAERRGSREASGSHYVKQIKAATRLSRFYLTGTFIFERSCSRRETNLVFHEKMGWRLSDRA